MNKYLVIYNQSSGCDYTIGCGINYEIIESESNYDLAIILKDKIE